MMFFVLSPFGVIATSLLQRGEFLIGPQASQANPGQAMLRAVLVYGFALLLVRLGHKRFLGRNSGIDILLSVILGSVLSRGINGTAPLGSLRGTRGPALGFRGRRLSVQSSRQTHQRGAE